MDPEVFDDEAKTLVDQVIDTALRRLETSMSEREHTFESLGYFDFARESKNEQPVMPREDNYEVKNINWLTIEEFSIQMAEEKIKEFIETWAYQDSWLYCVDFLGKDSHDFDHRYRFRVRWSVPTRRKPVPRSTACVYFTFVVSKIKPKDHSVDVFYVFETNRLVHRPGQSRFREKWLKDIIENKVMMMTTVVF
ncbi:hypothetical protein SNE40_000710 [Patella caerulea]|uniref:A-kinase anchor protein 14 n=1 Tax=Patella caerulea TaxID=87958 RepID=A0AAN8KCA0_PATCE